MPKLYIIGTGPGNPNLLTGYAKETIEKCDVLIGATRLVESYKSENRRVMECKTGEICEVIQSLRRESRIGILASGDVGFYSITKLIQRELGGAYEVEEISGISSLQYFCSRIHESYDEIYITSMHGRETHIVGEVLTHPKVFTLTGGKYPAHVICHLLCENGLEDTLVTIGENLSYPEEKIVKGLASELKKETFCDLAVMLLENKGYKSREIMTPGIKDEAFVRGKVPMTKEEVRVVSLAKLQIKSSDILYDVGAGTGSVSIEMAMQAKMGKVYAIEKNKEGIELIRQNIKQFGLQNIEVVEANFPEQIENLKLPDKVFIGGSGGNLEEIISKLLDLNEKVEIVINAITLETLGEATWCAKRHHLPLEVVELTAANSKVVGQYHMMMGQNPIFIIKIGGKIDG